MLRERFPAAHVGRADVAAWVVGVSVLDDLALSRGQVVEVVSAPGSGALLVHEVLRAGAAAGRLTGLVDGRDSFSPRDATPEALPALVWFRCREATQALRVADLLVRDGNLPLVLLDLQFNPARELQRIPRASWSRLSLLAEKSGTLLLTFTPQPLVAGAARRVTLQRPVSPDLLHMARRDLALHLQPAEARGEKTVVPFRLAG